MGDAFQEREKGFERKYEFDQAQAFKVHSRRDWLFGLWAAAHLGKAGAEADAYARELVAWNMDLPGDENMLRKVRKDLTAKSVPFEEKILATELRNAEAQAKKDVLGATS
jgi:hypothetical protein